MRGKEQRWIAMGCAALILSAATVVNGQMERRRMRAEDPPTITVSGSGEVTAEPDQAVLRLGSTAQAETAADAQEQVNEVMQKTLAEIRELGVPEDQIQTARVMLSPVYSQQTPRQPRETSEEPRIVAYRASNTLEIRLNDLSQIGDVIDAAVRSGANEIENLSFQLQDDTEARARALKRAVGEARAKAEAIAEAMNLRLTGVENVNESGVSFIRPQFEAMQARAMDVSTPIQPGELKVEASVSVSYRFEPASGVAARN